MKTAKNIFALWMLMLLCAANATAGTNYKILSSTESEMIIEVKPQYSFDTIRSSSGEFIKISFPDARYDDVVGSPMIPRLQLGFLLPAKTPLNVEIIEQVLSGTKSMTLVPYPLTIQTANGPQARYEYADFNAANFAQQELVTKDQLTTARTAYAQHVQITPVRYDAVSRSVKLVESIKLRIRFYGKATQVSAAPLSLAERDMFHAGYVNGTNASLYRSAQAQAMQTARREMGSKALKTTPQAAGEWLTIETDREGIYKITADDLRGAGITSMDPNSIELFGYGARLMPEGITDSSGEWRPLAIDVRTDGSGQLSEFLFYAPGNQFWKYQRRADRLLGLYHVINPYMSVGKFMLKVGGDNVAPRTRVSHQPDTITEVPKQASNVSVISVREVERAFEVGNLSRELVGELLPREGIDPLTVDVSVLPGYIPDSTILRVGTGGLIRKPNTYNVSVNGSKVGSIIGQVNPDKEDYPKPRRNWKSVFQLDASIGKPERVGINYSTTDPDGRAFLNWIEIFYRSNTTIGNTSLPFYVLDTKEAFEYSFTNASGGAVWDVSNATSPSLISGNASGNSLAVSIQGKTDILRQFVAFSDQSVLRVGGGKIARTSPLTLRQTIGQQGSTNIIITPEALREQAEDLRALREKGGHATEPVKSTVVSLEDIYKEFGYGAKDPVAIRDFMAYTYRHTIRNGTQVPMFLTLFGGGHVDYQNRITDLPTRIPVYELPGSEHVESLRSYSEVNTPDDGYYVRLTPKSGLSTMDPDVGVGRLSVQSADEAAVVVSKLKRYETSAAEGPWRARVSMVIDDRQGEGIGPDPLDHLADVESTTIWIPSRMQVNKVYGMNYQTVYTSGGRRKPEMEIAVNDAFNGGSIITSYIGHGNPKVWTHESVLQVPSSINKLNNYDKLTFVAMATCDFAEYDNYAEVSGGVMMLTREAGGAIGLLGTSRSVYPGEALYPKFFEGLFDVPCEAAYGSNHLGTALLISKLNRTGMNPVWFYLQADPAMRLLVPKQYAIVDSINNSPVSEEVSTIPALSEVRVTGRVSNTCEEISGIDPTFNGQATVTLFDTRTTVSRTTTFVSNNPITDVFQMEGPILYRGTATVRNGRFSANFIVPRDIKFDSNNAKISVIAYADDSRSALGSYERVRLAGSDPSIVISDSAGPELKVYIGTRAFRSGDIVPMNSNVIVDIKDELGLNTSTASVGHSFIGWVDDESDNSVNMAENYVSEQDNFRVGTAVTKMSLPAGRHTLRVRAFDALNNPSFTEVEFVAKDDDPFKLYNATVYPNPVKDQMTVSFMHPLNSGSLVDATLDIFTSDGRLVRTIESKNISGNIVEVRWDGSDDTGLINPQGAYTYRITISDQNDGRSASAFGNFVIVR